MEIVAERINVPARSHLQEQLRREAVLIPTEMGEDCSTTPLDTVTLKRSRTLRDPRKTRKNYPLHNSKLASWGQVSTCVWDRAQGGNSRLSGQKMSPIQNLNL